MKSAATLLALILTSCATTNRLAPPTAKRVPHEVTLHGDRLVDDYFWFREKENPELLRYLDAEEAYTNALMKPTEALQETLYQEMLSRVDQTDASVPFQKGEFLYYTRYEAGKQYPVYARKRSADAPEEVLLDVNALAVGQPYMGIRAF